MGQRASRVQKEPSQYKSLAPVPQEIIEIVYEDEDEGVTVLDDCLKATPDNPNFDPQFLHFGHIQSKSVFEINANISNILPFGIQRKPSYASTNAPSSCHEDTDMRGTVSPANPFEYTTNLPTVKHKHRKKHSDNLKENHKLFHSAVRTSKDTDIFLPVSSTYSDEFDPHDFPIHVKRNKKQVLGENDLCPPYCRQEPPCKEKCKMKYGQANARKVARNFEQNKIHEYAAQRPQRTKDDLKRRLTMEKYNPLLDTDMDPTICDSLVPSFSDLGNLSDCGRPDEVKSLKEEDLVNRKLMPSTRGKPLFRRDDKESSCTDNEDDGDATCGRNEDKENSSRKGHESDLDKAPSGYSDISDDKTIKNWLNDPRLTELFDGAFYSIDNECKRPVSFTPKLPPPHPNGAAVTVFTLKPEDEEPAPRKGLKFGDVPKSTKPESRLIPDCLHFIDIVRRRTSKKRYTGKSSDSIFIGGNVTNTNPSLSTNSRVNLATDCPLTLKGTSKPSLGETDPNSLKLYTYRFWLPATPLVNQLFTNAADRRVESIGRLSDCRIRLTKWRRLNSNGFPQQMVVIIAPSAEALQKCCRLFDDKFPFFYATAGLLICNQQQNTSPELKKKTRQFDRSHQMSPAHLRSCASLHRRVISPSVSKINTRHLNDWVRSNSGTIKGTGESDGHRASNFW